MSGAKRTAKSPNKVNDVLRPKVAIIGAGPAGLRAARELASRVDGAVMVFDREGEAGGIPRHAFHPGYGVRDLGRFMSGPKYAKRLTADAVRAGADIQLHTMATNWADERTLELTTPRGRRFVQPEAFILATGARERPRTARLIPGDRPAGVYTTGQLQQLVHLKHCKVGKRAVVVGAELVSWSAALTLKDAGCHTVALLTKYPKPDSYGLFSTFGRPFFHTKVITRSEVARIEGRGRVQAVVYRDIDSGAEHRIECDTVVFTGDWIPDNELARMAELDIDSKSLGLKVCDGFGTSRDGVFAIGNLVHPVTTADVAALDGVKSVTPVLEYLAGHIVSQSSVDIECRGPLRWIAPGKVSASFSSKVLKRLVSWTDEYRRFPKVCASQQGRVIGSVRTPWPAAPGRAFLIPASILDGVRQENGSVEIFLD